MTPKPPFLRRPKTSLVESIRVALSDDEITQLLELGSSYDHASDKTKLRWRKAAEARRGEIGHSSNTTE